MTFTSFQCEEKGGAAKSNYKQPKSKATFTILKTKKQLIKIIFNYLLVNSQNLSQSSYAVVLFFIISILTSLHIHTHTKTIPISRAGNPVVVIDHHFSTFISQSTVFFSFFGGGFELPYTKKNQKEQK